MGKGDNNNSFPKESSRNHSDNGPQRGYRSYHSNNSRRSTDYSYQQHQDDSFSYDDQRFDVEDYNNDYGNGGGTSGSEVTPNRKHHHHHHSRSSHSKSNHHRRGGDRDRRSRSRSNERNSEHNSRNSAYDSDNSSSSHYRNNKSYNDYREDRGYRENRHETRKEAPHNTLMVRNLPINITDNDLAAEVNQYGVIPKDIRLMKSKETGQSRGFAFIEFASIELATKFKELAQDYLTFGGTVECALHYSFPKDNQTSLDKSNIKSDWSCHKCGINNFKRRDECFKCGASRDESMQSEPDNEKLRQHPTNVLLLRNLSPNTTEETVLMRIGSLTSLPIKSIRMIPDPNQTYPQTNICSVELHSVYEATNLFATIQAMSDGLTIDNHLVTVSYGQRMETTLLMNAAKRQSLAAKQNVAMAALAAAQWKNLDDSSGKQATTTKSSQIGTVTVNGVEYTKYNPPDYNSFQYDHSTGFYYDASTGFYYDSKSGYFYNSQTQKYMYFDTTNQIYIIMDSNGNATSEPQKAPAAATVTSTGSSSKIAESVNKPEDKAKMAKKIAKDMEKWAKTLNQKKVEQQLPQQTTTEQSSLETESLSANASYYVFEKQLSNNDDDTILKSDNYPSAIATTCASSSSSDPFEIIKSEEERLIDRKRLACLLCKRQFNTDELLTKHQQLSSLHKTNLSVLRRSLLNDEQLEQVEQVERESGYRDRAKERRDKFGIDNTPEYSKHKQYLMEQDSVNEPDVAPAPPAPISDDNIGSRMLKAMGWTEGMGLGKSNQGMSTIIQVERRKSGLGLGNQNATITDASTGSSSKTYKDAVRRSAYQRFKQMNDN